MVQYSLVDILDLVPRPVRREVVHAEVEALPFQVLDLVPHQGPQW